MPDGSFVERMQYLQNSAPVPDIHIVFPAQELSVRRALHSVRASLRSMTVDDETLLRVEIVLAEVTNNIVEHAYRDDDTGTITLSCRMLETHLEFHLSDCGALLPDSELPQKQDHDLNGELANLPEGGFGWGLIHDLTSDLAYQRQNGKNILHFKVPKTAI